MPQYSYVCADCGPFDETRPMALFAEPCPCPECGRAAARQLSAASLMAGASKAEPSAQPSSARRHRAGCGCCTPAQRGGLKAEAINAGAPKRSGKTPPPASLLARP